MEVKNIPKWPVAEGFYQQNSSLNDCNSLGKPRYKHINGHGYLFATPTGWVGSTQLCDNATLWFRALDMAASPDLVVLATWEMAGSGGTTIHAGLTVTASLCRKLSFM